MTADHGFKTGDRVMHPTYGEVVFEVAVPGGGASVVDRFHRTDDEHYYSIVPLSDLSPLPEWTVTISHRGEVVGSFGLPDEEVQAAMPSTSRVAAIQASDRFRAALVEAREAEK